MRCEAMNRTLCVCVCLCVCVSVFECVCVCLCVLGAESSGIILGDQRLEIEPAMGRFKQSVVQAEGTAN